MAAQDVQNVRIAQQEVTIRLPDKSLLFVPPDQNPYLNDEFHVLGQSAMDRLIARILADRSAMRDLKRLTLYLPADQAEPAAQTEIIAAIRRYSKVKQDDNDLQIRASRRQALRQLITVAIVLAVILIAVILFWSAGYLSTDTPVGVLVAFSVCVLVWVTVWDPVEALAFEWIPWSRENQILEKIDRMEVTVLPDKDAAN